MKRRVTKRKSPTRRPVKAAAKRPRRGAPLVTVREIDAMRDELQRRAHDVPRWNADPDDVQRSVARLVLTLVEFLRKLMERQAIRRMDAGTLSEAQTEDVGRALMELEATVSDMATKFGIHPDDLNMDLGPIGKLM